MSSNHLQIDLKLRCTLTVALSFFLLGANCPGLEGKTNSRPWEVDLSGEWKFKAGDDEHYASLQFDDSRWETLYAPALWDGQGYSDYDGYGWYRKWFFVPKELSGKEILFEHGGVDDNDWVYINGVKVGEGKGCYIPRSYIIPAKLIKYGGRNLIAIRIYDGAMGGGLARSPLRVREMRLSDRIAISGVSIVGNVGSRVMTLTMTLMSKDGKPHKPKLSVSVVDHFLRKRFHRSLESPIQPNERKELEFQFEGGDSKDYRVNVELAEGNERDQLFWHILSDITSGMRPTIVLSGDWEMMLPPDDKLSFPPTGNWQPIKVPMLSWGGWSGKNHRVWFRKQFEMPGEFFGRRIILRFEAVAHHAVVYVNGKMIGEHLGGFEPFEFDITEAAMVGAKNELLVGVTDWVAGLVEGITPPDDTEKMPKDSMLIPYGNRPQARRGIWDDVFVYARNALHIADGFIITSVRNKTLTVKVRLQNDTDNAASVDLIGDVYDGDVKMLSLPKKSVTVPAHGSVDIELSKPVSLEDNGAGKRASKAFRLWFPHEPYLYRLALQLFKDGQRVDELNLRFGFREIWIDGIDYRLNGRIFKLRGLGCPPTTATREEIRHYYLERLKANFTLVRFHMQPRQRHFYEIADEVGMCLKDESAFYCAANVYALGEERLWRNLSEHIAGMVMRSRNHPSLLIWSVENEILHCGGMRINGTDERIYELGKLIMKLDPTRPIEFEGDGDVNGRAATVNIHYPREFGCHDHNLFPNDAYWLGKEGNDRWPRELIWKRDKPLIIGEFCYYPYSRPPGGVSIFLGDAVYVNREIEREAHRIGVRMLCDGTRRMGVAGLNPWVDDLRYSTECLKPIAATLNQYDKTFLSGETVEREIAVHNDTLHRRKLTLTASVKVGNALLAKRSFNLDMDCGEMRIVKFAWQMPSVKERTKASLKLSIQDGARVVFDEEHKLWVFSRTRLQIPKGLKVALFDPAGETAKALAKLDLHPQTLGGLNGKFLQQVNLLLIGKGATETEAFKSGVNALLKFIHDGGMAFCFEQLSQPEWLPIQLRLDTRRAATMAYIRHSSHPLLDGMQPDDFKWWRGDHFVARSSFVKPSRGAFRILVECGGRGGLRWTPLVELLYGSGALIMCQLELTDKLPVEPIAQKLMHNLFAYAISFKPSSMKRIALISPKGSPMLKAFKDIGMPFDDVAHRFDEVNFDSYGLLLIDGDLLELCKGRLDELRSFISRGGIVWIHQPKSVELLRRMTLRVVGLTKQKLGGRIVKASDDELLASISNSDLFWYREDCWYADWEGRGSGLIDDPAISVIELAEGDGVKALTKPCALAKIEIGNGFLLIDTLRLTDPPSEVRDKAMRILSALLTSLFLQQR
ncbi:MAG: hypothetical protein N2381_05455 [Armatimonadetes bacterium]|nr:hypothetical protein [Armatimonadota bacterium]